LKILFNLQYEKRLTQRNALRPEAIMTACYNMLKARVAFYIIKAQFSIEVFATLTG